MIPGSQTITWITSIAAIYFSAISSVRAEPSLQEGVAATPSHRQLGEKPNIVLILIDDWAWNGTPISMDPDMDNSAMPVLEMPHLESLAREGMTFRNAYASPQCSPSRVCIQTGQSSPRNGFTVFLNSGGQEYFDEKKSVGLPVISCVSDMTIDPEAVTIPEALAPLGYVSAHIGKWHMRGDPGDEGYTVHDGDTSNSPGNTVGKATRLPEDMTDPKLIDSVTERAVSFIEKQAEAKNPFFLQISHYAMHEGRECPHRLREKYAKTPAVQAYYKAIGETAETIRRKQDPAIWLGMGEHLDDSIGRVLSKLEDTSASENTFVVMLSDNGYRHSFLPGQTQPMHGKKWWLWQGGIRVPMLIRGPGIAAGSRFEGNVINYDLLPTFLEWAGGNPDSLQDIDGISLASYLSGTEPTEAFLNRSLYFHYPHNRTSMPHSAIVAGSWKVMHFYNEPELPMLFDLRTDEAETNNVAEVRRRKHRLLYQDLMGYLKDVGARMPKPNLDFDRQAYEQTEVFEDRLPYAAFNGKRNLAEDEK
ncbi:MAG: sulfatase [Verrucomicrobiota bacterium]